MLYISKANGIDFAKRENAPPNRINTLSYEEKHGGFRTFEFCQEFKTDDIVKVQISSAVATLPTIEVFQPEQTAGLTVTLVSSYTSDSNPGNWRFYFEFDVNFAAYIGKTIQIKVTQGSDQYLSEYLKGNLTDEDINNGKYQLFEYGNSSQPADYGNYEVDYTTGISFFFYLQSVLKKPAPKGEDEVYKGIKSQTLLEAKLYIGKILAIARIPDFMVNKLYVAGKHFLFKINGIQYITDGIPDIDDSNTNSYPVTWDVTEALSFGVNTDNIQFIGESQVKAPVILSQNSSVSGTWTFTLEFDYMLHLIFARHNTSSIADFKFKVGTTPGGDELLSLFTTTVPLAGGTEYKSYQIHNVVNTSSNVTIYVEIEGIGAIADFYVPKLLNV